ncbi:MAG: hypothetical protein PHS53_05110 [Candidatus Pacebacteria bacterium]|nr:hypothetical protein [Candidatus Paceibacterota bacterium]
MSIENASSQGTPTPRALLDALLAQYEYLKDVPEKELEKIGYVKITGEGSVRVVSKEKFEKEQAIQREKLEKAPFDQILVSTEKTRVGRVLPVVDAELIGKDIDDVEWVGPELDGLYGGDSSILFLQEYLLSNKSIRRKLLEYFHLNDRTDYHYFMEDIFALNGISHLTSDGREELEKTWETLMEQAKKRVANHEPEEDEDENEEVADEDDEEVFPSEETEKMYDELERLRGTISDPHFYEERFANTVTDKFDGWFEDNVNIKGIGIFEVSKYVFTTALREDEAFQAAAQELEKATTPEEAISALAKIRIEKTAEEKQLTVEMRTATIEEKKEKSARLKALREEREHKLKFISGIMEYYHMPKHAARFIDLVVKDVQDSLKRGAKNEERVVLTLLGKPDKEMDRDPGKISGDCTAGKPLPFNNPKLLLYNVKVLREKDHIGNIYLLETTFAKTKARVWHLDAIQIPLSVNWRDTIQSLFEELKKSAREKNIEAITVNQQAEKISNYDYIQKAVLRYCTEMNAKKEHVIIPQPKSQEVDEEDQTNSPFQSNGEVFSIPVK